MGVRVLLCRNVKQGRIKVDPLEAGPLGEARAAVGWSRPRP